MRALERAVRSAGAPDRSLICGVDGAAAPDRLLWSVGKHRKRPLYPLAGGHAEHTQQHLAVAILQHQRRMPPHVQLRRQLRAGR